MQNARKGKLEACKFMIGGKFYPHSAAVHLQSRFNALIKGEEEQVFSQPTGETSEL